MSFAEIIQQSLEDSGIIFRKLFCRNLAEKARRKCYAARPNTAGQIKIFL